MLGGEVLPFALLGKAQAPLWRGCALSFTSPLHPIAPPPILGSTGPHLPLHPIAPPPRIQVLIFHRTLLDWLRTLDPSHKPEGGCSPFPSPRPYDTPTSNMPRCE